MENDQFDALCNDVRNLAQEGRSIADMFRLIQARMGEIQSTILALRVFYRVFDVPLSELKDLSLWNGFNGGDFGLNDDEVEKRVRGCLRSPVRSAKPEDVE